LTTVQNLAKNNLLLFFSQIISLFFGLFNVAYMARYLGAGDFGVLSVALAFTGIFGLIGDLGLSSLTTREVSRNRSLAPKYLGNILLIKVFLAIITFAIVALVVNGLGYSEKTIIVVYIITLSTILTNFTQMFNSIFQAFEIFEYISISVILSSVLMTLGIFFAMEQKFGLIYFAFIYPTVSVIILAYSAFICLKKFVIPSLNIDWVFWKRVVLESIPFWLNTVFVVIYFKIDMVMLSKMSGDTAVGLYSASYRLIDALSFIPAVLMSTMYPLFSKFHVSSIDSLDFAFKKSFKCLSIIAIPIGVGTTILAEKIIVFIYGVQYIPSSIALQILIWASVLGFLNNSPATYLSSTNRQRILMIITCLGAILNIVLNFALIPKFSYTGAAIATVCSELVVGLLLIYTLRKTHTLPVRFFDIIPKSIISGIFMGVFLVIFYKYPLIMLILVAAILYFIVLYIVNGFEQEDLNLFNQALGR
jgi:Membrane protein involved in the export of O-antigen and teichoic acid